MPSLPLVSPVSGRVSTVYGIFIESQKSGSLRLELRREILRRARNAVFVRTPVDDRLGDEVAVSRRRRRRPLEGRRLPWILVYHFAPDEAGEEVDDERNLEQTECP